MSQNAHVIFVVCREPSDLVVTMDASGSITKEQFYLYLDFFVKVVEDLPIGSGTQMALQTFSQDESVYFDLNVIFKYLLFITSESMQQIS